jgi:hypothetical protein
MPLTFLLTYHRLVPGVGRRKGIDLVLAGLGVAILVWGCDSGSSSDRQARAGSASDEFELASPPLVFEASSEGGLYRIRTRPAELPLKLHQMHDWIVGIELMGGSSEIPTAVRFDGGMPSHGHGFVTRPRVTQNLGGGEFLVEGVKFHMPGDWMLQITVTSRGATDQVSFPLRVDP